MSPDRELETAREENRLLRQRIDQLVGIDPDLPLSELRLREENAKWRGFFRAAVDAYPKDTPMPQKVREWWEELYYAVVGRHA